MSYISDIFDRLDLQQIREFLFHGNECMEVSNETYEQRLKKASESCVKLIEEKFPDLDERENVLGEIHEYVSETENVYMEIGLKCGANLMLKLMDKSGD